MTTKKNADALIVSLLAATTRQPDVLLMPYTGMGPPAPFVTITHQRGNLLVRATPMSLATWAQRVHETRSAWNDVIPKPVKPRKFAWAREKIEPDAQ